MRLKKQNATTQQEIDALELERIDTRPEIIFDDDVLPILIENPKTSELKKQWLKKQKEREEESEWARIKEEYEKALKKWLKQYNKQEKRYNETRSDEDYRILKQLELNKPRLYDDEGNEIIDMTTPLQRQEQPISQQQQRSRQQQQRQTILQEQQRSRQHQQQQKLAQQQQSSRQHQQQQKLAQQQQSSRQHQQQQTISQEQQRSRQHQRQQKLAQQEKVENQQISKISSNDSSHESKASALSNIKQSTSEQSESLEELKRRFFYLAKQHDEKYEIKKQKATSQEEIDALELERIDNRPEILHDENLRPFLIENPKTSELKKQLLKRDKERTKARIREEYKRALKKWNKQYNEQKKRYKETRSDKDYRILKQLELNKPTLSDDEDDEIIDMTKPPQRQEQPISQQQQRSRQQQQQQKLTNKSKNSDNRDSMTEPSSLPLRQRKKSLSKKTTTNLKSSNFPTTTKTTEPGIKRSIYSEIAKKAYEDGFKYPYYDLVDEKQNLVNSWEIRKADYKDKLYDLEQLKKTDKMKKDEYNALEKEYKKNKSEFLDQEDEIDDKIKEAKKQMEKEIKAKETGILEQIESFGEDGREKTENAIKNDLEGKSGIGKKLMNIFKSKDKKTIKPVLDELDYRIEPILTDKEIDTLKQGIKPSSVNKEYRTSVLQKMLELQSAAANDKEKTKEAILFRDDYVKPLHKQLLNENLQSDKSEIKPILTNEDRDYLHQMIDTSQSEQENYRVYILNEIEEIERSIPLTENNRNDLSEFIEIFKKRLSDDKKIPEYPISKFRRKFLEGPNPVISAEQEDFLYYEAMIKPKIYNRPVDYYVWFFKELYTTKGKYFYDPSHNRFATVNTEENNSLLKKLLSESVSHSARNRYRRSISSQIPTVAINIAENTDLPSNQQQSKYGDQSKSSSLSSSQSSNTDSLTKRVQRSVNQAFLQTATQISEHPFTDYGKQF
ncbi:uncharacterized protein LOC142645588 [Dermatophagoides pteronyssinus]|uniref:uncharacterized protein LOC142645588 n=1 Tax=Dermatophagoides pteronyssinus TaxID=6956 RepID=UPI003F669A42